MRKGKKKKERKREDREKERVCIYETKINNNKNAKITAPWPKCSYSGLPEPPGRPAVHV
jgi:hypothetical protein